MKEKMEAAVQGSRCQRRRPAVARRSAGEDAAARGTLHHARHRQERPAEQGRAPARRAAARQAPGTEDLIAESHVLKRKAAGPYGPAAFFCPLRLLRLSACSPTRRALAFAFALAFTGEVKLRGCAARSSPAAIRRVERAGQRTGSVAIAPSRCAPRLLVADGRRSASSPALRAQRPSPSRAIRRDPRPHCRSPRPSHPTTNHWQRQRHCLPCSCRPRFHSSPSTRCPGTCRRRSRREFDTRSRTRPWCHACDRPRPWCDGAARRCDRGCRRGRRCALPWPMPPMEPMPPPSVPPSEPPSPPPAPPPRICACKAGAPQNSASTATGLIKCLIFMSLLLSCWFACRGTSAALRRYYAREGRFLPWRPEEFYLT